MFINYSEGDKRLIKPCWVAVTSTFPSSSSPRSAWGLYKHRATPDVCGGLRLPAWVTSRDVPPARPCGGVSQAGTTPNADHRLEISTRPWLSRNGAGDVSRWHYFFCDWSCWFPPRLRAGSWTRGSTRLGAKPFPYPRQRWEPALGSTGNATAGAGSRGGSSQGPHGDLSCWRLPSHRVRCPAVTQ